MKNRNAWSLTFTLLLMIAALVSPKAFVRNGVTAANSNAAMAAPLPAPAKPDLSVQVAKFFAPDFKPSGATKAPVNTVLFTADELKKSGSNRITQAGGKFFVTTKKINLLTKKVMVVPIEEYVAQLNGYEMYLNKLGYSLRSGPPNLGRILTLIKKRPTSPPGGDRRLTKKFFFDPTIYERSGAVRGAKINPVERSGNTRLNPASSGIINTQQIQAARLKAMAPREILLPSGSAGFGTRVMKTEGMCPCVTCGSPSAAPPASSLNPICLNGLCPSADGLSCVKCGGGASPSINSSTSLGQYCGEKSAKCKSSKCLYDGYLAGQWTGLSKCVSATDGNDWFDASLCVDISSSNCGAEKKLNLRNGGSLHSELKIFGFSIPVLDMAATASWDGQAAQESEFKFLGETVEPIKFSQDVPGPRAIFPIGPVPVTISSKLHFGFDVGKPDFTFPSKLSPGACSLNDTLNVGVGLNLNSFIALDAYVDAFVARVGVEGQLILADDYFGVGIKSLVSPAKNEVLVTPGLQYRLKHLAGKLFLYAEIDVLVYSKRFEVQIFDLDSGLGTDGKIVTEPFTQKSFGAIDPTPTE